MPAQGLVRDIVCRRHPSATPHPNGRSGWASKSESSCPFTFGRSVAGFCTSPLPMSASRDTTARFSAAMALVIVARDTGEPPQLRCTCMSPAYHPVGSGPAARTEIPCQPTSPNASARRIADRHSTAPIPTAFLKRLELKDTTFRRPFAPLCQEFIALNLKIQAMFLGQTVLQEPPCVEQHAQYSPSWHFAHLSRIRMRTSGKPLTMSHLASRASARTLRERAPLGPRRGLTAFTRSAVSSSTSVLVPV